MLLLELLIHPFSAPFAQWVPPLLVNINLVHRNITIFTPVFDVGKRFGLEHLRAHGQGAVP